jgi:hypothetical protein
MRMTRKCRTGLRLIFLGLIPLLCWVAWFYTRTWVLLDVPISLSKGSHFSAGEFTANMNRPYSIEINAVVKDRTESSSEKLPCPFGSQFTSEGSMPDRSRVEYALGSIQRKVRPCKVISARTWKLECMPGLP